MAIKKFNRQELFFISVGHKFPSTITCTKLTVYYQNSTCFDRSHDLEEAVFQTHVATVLHAF